MSNTGGMGDPTAIARAIRAFQAIVDQVVDANVTGDQVIYTVPAGTKLYTAGIIYIAETGTITVGVLKIGFNAAANNVILSRALTSLSSPSSSLRDNPINGFATGQPGDVLKVNMTTPSGVPGTFRVIVEGYLS